MGIFDDSAYASPQVPQAPVPTAAPTIDRQSVPITSAAPQNYQDFYNRLVATRVAAAQIPSNNALFGLHTDAKIALAKASAANDAPGLWQQYQKAQMANQEQGVGLAGNIASQQAMLPGVTIDPNNPNASIPAQTQAYQKFFNQGNDDNQQAPQGQPQAAPANSPLSFQGSGQLFGNAPQAQAPAAQAPQAPQAPNGQVPLGIRNNNPGNLQPGGKEATYSSPTAGILAAASNVDNYASQGINTVSGIISKWAPPADANGKPINNTPAYIADVAQRLGVNPNAPLNLKDPNVKGALLQAMFAHENGNGAMAAQGAQPQGGQPQGAVPQNDPAARMRAFYTRLALAGAIRNNPAAFKAYSDIAHNGQPALTQLDPRGNFVPTQVQTPGGAISGQEYEARTSGLKTQADKIAGNTESGVPVIGRKGPTTISADEQLHGSNQMGADGKPNYLLPDSPQYKAIQAQQTKDLTDLNKTVTDDRSVANTATQIYNAASNVRTGFGAQAVQDARKAIVALLQSAGAQVDPNTVAHAADFEKLAFAGLNFVQSSAHSFSPRAAQQIVKMIQAVKPGAATTPQGLKQIITQEVLPPLMQDQAVYKQTADYYQKNPLSQDAMTVVPGRNPIGNFSVKSHTNAQPGDFFIDSRKTLKGGQPNPNYNLLRQRPLQ